MTSVITIFAIMIGMSAVAPVLADPPEGNKVFICHNQTKDKTIDEVIQPAGWYPQEIAVKSLEKHKDKHGDFVISSLDDSACPPSDDVGLLDIVVANFNSNNVSVLLNDGAGNFAAATNFAVGVSPFSVAVGDFN